MLSASELAQIQTDAAATLDKPCEVYRATSSVADGYGTETPDYIQISPNGLMAGMTEPTAGQLQNYDYLIGDLAAWHVRLPVGTDVEHQDHLIIDGVLLEVQVILQPRSYQALMSVIASEVQ